MNRILVVVTLLLTLSAPLFAAGAEESAGSASRGRYLAGQGIIVPPEEVLVHNYIAQINYNYPSPGGPVGVTLYTANQQLSNRGQESVLHIGIQGETRGWDGLAPMNLAFVIDTSASMADENKLEWVQSAFELFIDRVRPTDYLSLIAFSDTPTTLVPSVRVSDDEVKARFSRAVAELVAQGGSDLEAGLKAGYEQIMRNYRADYTNRVLFLSDGTEISSRLSRAGGQTGQIRATLIWNNRNDLDLHMITPTGEEIFYGNSLSASGGQLDVDMNVGGETTKPVENIFWPTYSAPPEGPYEVFVRNYGYNEPRRGPTDFIVDLKFGSETSRFEGTVSGTGPRSDVVAFRFNFAADSVRKAEIYQIAEQYRALGINVTTIGVGTGFDLDFMNNLAKESGGSSRFIADRREMEEIFGSEFDRMIISAAKDLAIDVEFLTDVEILETWGYNHEIGDNGVRFSQATLHARDYETILIRYAIPPGAPLGPLPLAQVTVEYDTLGGLREAVVADPVTVHIVDTPVPVSGYSNGVVLQSGTMMDFARRMERIGELYYDARDLSYGSVDEVPSGAVEGLEEALELSRLGRAEWETAGLRLDDSAFDDEVEIFNAYERILRTDLGVLTQPVGQVGEPVEPSDQPADREPAQLPALPSEVALETHVKHLVDEIILGFPAGGTPVVAVAGVAPGPTSSGVLVELINSGLLTALASQSGISVVERDRIAQILEEQELSLSGLVDTTTAVRIGNIAAAQYIVTGSLIETTESVIIFARVVNVESGVVESAAQAIVSRASVPEG